MKRIEIIPIAQRKIEKRGIRRDQIEEAVANPAQVVDGYGGRKVAHKIVLIGEKEYLLRVVYEEGVDSVAIVTAYLTSQIKRYWSYESGSEKEGKK